MYIDPHTGQVIESDRPCVVQLTPFVSQKIADGIVELITPNLPLRAMDTDFAVHFASFKDAENGRNAAIASFVSQFGLDESGNKTADYVEPKVEKTDEELMAELEAEEKAKEKEAEKNNKDSVMKNIFGKPKK